MSWWKRLFAQRDGAEQPRENEAPAGFYIAPRTETDSRVEIALPGTADIPHILTLIPPSVAPELAPDHDPERHFAPDPIAEYSVEWVAAKPFRRDDFRASYSKEDHERFGRPSLFARLPGGRIVFLSMEADPMATSIIAAWSLRGRDGSLGEIAGRVQSMSDGMACRTEGFSTAPEGPSRVVPAPVKLYSQWQRAQSIIAVKPEHVAILAVPRRPPLNGKAVWQTLHGMGISWGDMDQFQWSDPTHQTDYLFWAEVDDGNIGYALPEMIASGQQDFLRVRFIFEVARSPAPAHVLKEMQRAAMQFAEMMDCDLVYSVDHVQGAGIANIEAAVTRCASELERLGVKSGSSSVCILR